MRFIQIRGVGERSEFDSVPTNSIGYYYDHIDLSGISGVVALLPVPGTIPKDMTESSVLESELVEPTLPLWGPLLMLLVVGMILFQSTGSPW